MICFDHRKVIAVIPDYKEFGIAPVLMAQEIGDALVFIDTFAVEVEVLTIDIARKHIWEICFDFCKCCARFLLILKSEAHLYHIVDFERVLQSGKRCQMRGWCIIAVAIDICTGGSEK